MLKVIAFSAFRLSYSLLVARSRLSFSMICRHNILVGACALCLVEGAAQALEERSDTDRLQSVGIISLYQEFPEPHPPTDEAGAQFEAPPIVSSVLGANRAVWARGVAGSTGRAGLGVNRS